MKSPTTNHTEFTFQRLWAGVAVGLICTTWRLWFPTIADSGYPAIAFFPSLAGCPEWILDATSFFIVAALIAIAALGNAAPITRAGWIVVVVGLVVSFALDQHRLQPWAYQLAIYALMFAALDPARLRQWIIPVAASVYIYSAMGKFDFQFAHTVGQDFLAAVARPFGVNLDAIDETMRTRLALIFPATELLAGLALLIPRIRPIAGVIITMMHATLIAILGPWSLDHSLGVLTWNAALMFQTYWWMIRRPIPTNFTDVNGKKQPSTHRSVLTTMVIGLVLIAPLTERWGVWDHWLSWSLYSPHTSRVDIQVHDSATSAMNEDIVSMLEADDDNDGWRTFPLSRWALDSRGVPVYPQSRYQLDLAIEFAKQQGLDRDVRASLQSMSNRWTGTRDRKWLGGLAEMKKAKNY
ncbi:hypothetical protein [Rubripirellula reticaptiva]|uniref:Uncharacterized protein n=1 Tax=Rubripirellula reticaptiva TaxID=2528013 RepID=A0A5C6FAQ5_9BACT|nr:hypothetical protein [Rubripirellula reticaptiva]TWU57842.1 hypothetical protein Poly59_07510 [Rubripirellula reticaptiva]